MPDGTTCSCLGQSPVIGRFSAFPLVRAADGLHRLGGQLDSERWSRATRPPGVTRHGR
jgi:hypothetical protein